MEKCAERVQTYRFRAEALRTMSDTWIDTGTQQILGRVARDYDRMADRLEGKQVGQAPVLRAPRSCSNSRRPLGY
jgi:hypothetical protein